MLCILITLVSPFSYRHGFDEGSREFVYLFMLIFKYHLTNNVLKNLVKISTVYFDYSDYNQRISLIIVNQ